MTTELAIIASVIGGAAGLVAGIKHEMEGLHLIFAVAGAVFLALILTYIAILALKVLIVAAMIVGIYYAAQWIQGLLRR